MSLLRPLLLPCVAAMLLASSCKKDRNDGVPLTGVDITINITLPEYNDLMVSGGWVYVTGGSQGLIIYRFLDDFVVLDRHCPHQPQDLCRVVVDEGGVTASDTACCHSRFSILDGSVLEPPATTGLRRYNTTFNGTILRIYN
jgi:nitrite reductase/ring-hydroxylating ferredoxin subunit